MSKDDKLPLSNPERADNSEESVKCPSCGMMIGLGYEDEAMIMCPVCEEQIPTDEVNTFYASNEDY
ncbi:MAG: hypothetical protein GX050_08730 [Firmicutes bacterium]|nr:hypothetical protein [Bacillota bacterium]